MRYYDPDRPPRLLSSRDATPWTKRTEITGVALAVAGLHFHSASLIVGGCVVLIGGGIFDLFFRRGPLFIKVLMAGGAIGIALMFFHNPHQTFLWFQSFGAHAGHFITPNWKGPQP